MTGIAFTLDLEDHRLDAFSERRYPEVTTRLLDDLDEWGVRGTVFVVGEICRDSPELVAEVTRRGHEIGLHGADHTPLPEVGPDRFRVRTADARARLADLTGTPVSGFRAPIFSLVPESVWAPAILTELGFTYSSSVLPARNPLYGWPDAPRGPFLWESGLVELPSPAFGPGRFRLPILGGTYLRLAPRSLSGWFGARALRDGHPWVYAHPYDFDPDEPRWTVPEVGRFASRLLWWNRRTMKDRVRGLVDGSRLTLGEMAAGLTDLEVFEPGGGRS